MEGPDGFGKRIATAALIITTAFCSLPNASAQSESSPEEIIVRGYSYGEIREQIRIREQAVFIRFNEINSDDQFDIHCKMDSKAESRTLERRCLSNSWREQERNYARAFSGRVTLTAGNDPAEFRAEQLRMQAKLKEEMRRLSYEDPALGEAVLQLGQAMQALQFRRGGRPTYTAFRTVETDGDESLFNAERVFEVQIGMSAWTHYLRYRTFTLGDVSGTVRKIDVDCEEGRRTVDYEPNVEWTIPQDWSRCLLRVRAKRGSKVMFYEFE
jgi:hypothetical protein